MLPSLSVEPAALAITASGACPETGETLSAATGGWFANTEAVAVELRPCASTTVTVAVHEPAAYVCVAVAEACGPALAPSPKSNVYDTMAPSGSVDPAALSVTTAGA